MWSQKIRITKSKTKIKLQNKDNWNEKVKIIKIIDMESQKIIWKIINYIHSWQKLPRLKKER